MGTTKLLSLAFLLLISFHTVPAQPDTDSYRYNTSFSPGIAVLIIVLVIFFFLIVFFSIYIHRRTVVPTTVSPLPTRSSVPASSAGLDQSLIASFPTMLYSEAAEVTTNEGSLECAVCLTEFGGDEMLTMLPRCCHVFHPDCIGGWLAGHRTCPVCRADLSVAVEEEEMRKVDLGKIGRSNTIAVADRYTLRVTEKVRREIVMKRSASVAAVAVGRRGRSERWGSLVRSLSMWRTRDAGEGTSAAVGPEETV